MGCGGSKSSRLNNVDDSVHVMINHDKKVQQRKGQPVHGYKPRAQHPLLMPNDKNDQEHAGEGSTGGEEMMTANANTTNNNTCNNIGMKTRVINEEVGHDSVTK